MHIKWLILDVYSTSYLEVLFGLCEQAKEANLHGDQEDTTQWTGKDKATLENQLASCKEENESLRQHMKKMEKAHQAS